MSIRRFVDEDFSFLFSPAANKALRTLGSSIGKTPMSQPLLRTLTRANILPIKKNLKSLKIMKKKITAYCNSQVGSHPQCLVAKSHLSPERCEPCLVLSLITAKKFTSRLSHMCHRKHGFSLNLAARMSWLPPSSGISTKSSWRAEWLLRKTLGLRRGSWRGRCWWEDVRIVLCEGKSRGQEDLFSYHFWNSTPARSHAPRLYPVLLGPVPPFCLPATWGGEASLGLCRVINQWVRTES